MSKLMESIVAKAKANNRHIVLAEGEEPRIIKAAETIVAEGIARLTLLGNKDTIYSMSSAEKLAGVNIVDPKNCEELKEYAHLLYELRKAKGMTEEKALVVAQDPLFFGCLMIKSGKADGMVAGSINSTGNVLRSALQVIKTKPGVKTVSSCFIMDLPEGTHYGDNGIMIFADCAVLPCPTAEQMVDIAHASVDSARKIAGIKEPKVAMLSFSTKGSAKHELVDKVTTATALLADTNPDFEFDGELQLDAAIVPTVGELKAPNSHVAGHANVLVFPDLQSGNIGYKLVQRFGSADAIGPICQGFNAPVNDLSRGCSAEDVVSVVAITSIQ